MTTQIVENFRVKFALEAAARGWQVIPLHHPRSTASGKLICSCGSMYCESPGKHPRTLHGLKDSSVDPDVIRGWWEKWPGANVGIVTGEISGIVVLDIDPRHGGNDTIVKVSRDHGALPITVMAATGGGGSHVVFKHPGGKVPNSVGDKGWLGLPGWDIRGDGGYIVAPPSLHMSSERYSWEEGAGPDEMPLSPMPAWMLALLAPDLPMEPKVKPAVAKKADDAEHWLGKALAKSSDGNRNDTGFWLACQLRDSQISESEAGRIMCAYAERTPRGEKPYTEKEALASLRQAYDESPRDPARSPSRTSQVLKSVVVPAKSGGSADELRAHLENVISGAFFNAPWPWDKLTTLTQALVPGSITVVCGDPGVGKTFLILECLQFWLDHDFNPRVFFIEKDRKFHTHRLLAQLESDGKFVELDWVRNHPQQVREAMDRHERTLNDVGPCIESKQAERVTLDGLLEWVDKSTRAGSRILVIDPITAAFAGAERWTKDDDFVLACEAILTARSASLVMITHSKKSGKPGAVSGHDMGGGAAYFRFSDTTIWIKRTRKLRNVRYQTKMGPTQGKFTLFFELHKTRNGRGAGLELAYSFGPDLRFLEKGLVIGEASDEESDAA